MTMVLKTAQFARDEVLWLARHQPLQQPKKGKSPDFFSDPFGACTDAR